MASWRMIELPVVERVALSELADKVNMRESELLAALIRKAALEYLREGVEDERK